MSQQNKIPETVAEYDTVIKKLEDSIATHRSGAIEKGLQSLLIFSVVFMLNEMFTDIPGYESWGRAGMYSAVTAIILLMSAYAINQLSISSALNATRCEMTKRRWDARRNELIKMFVGRNRNQ